jgi:hypothetical protein
MSDPSSPAPVQTDVAAPARITVHRSSPEDAKQRQVILTLDGAPLATLLYGQRVTREIPAGRHWLRANNTLVWKTIEFDATPGADLHFSIVNRAARGMLWMVALFGAGPMFVSIERVPPPPASGPAADRSL